MLAKNIWSPIALALTFALLIMGCDGKAPGTTNDNLNNTNANENQNNNNQNTNTNTNANNNNGGLLIEVDVSTPSAATIPSWATGVTYVIYAFTSFEASDIEMQVIVVTRDGTDGDSGDFHSVRLFVGGLQLGSPKSFNTNTHEATFTVAHIPFIIPPFATVLVAVRGDMDSVGDKENRICIFDHFDVEAYSNDHDVEILGDFPACGESMTTIDATSP